MSSRFLLKVNDRNFFQRKPLQPEVYFKFISSIIKIYRVLDISKDEQATKTKLKLQYSRYLSVEKQIGLNDFVPGTSFYMHFTDFKYMWQTKGSRFWISHSSTSVNILQIINLYFFGQYLLHTGSSAKDNFENITIEVQFEIFLCLIENSGFTPEIFNHSRYFKSYCVIISIGI